MTQKYNDFKDQNYTYEQNVPVGLPVTGQVVHPNQQYHPQPPHPPQPPMQPQYYQQPQQNNGVPNQLAPQQVQGGGNYSFPVQTVCPCCKQHVTTIVNKEPGNTTYLWFGGCLVCCCISFCAPACLVPYLMNGCLDKNHYCPTCGFNIVRKHQSLCECCD